MTGQLIKRNENTWLVRIFLGRDADGKRKYFNKTIHGTKKDAQKFLTAKTREKDLGIFIEPGAMSLNECLDKWLEEIAKPRLRESTHNQYVWITKSYIRKKLGLIRLVLSNQRYCSNELICVILSNAKKKTNHPLIRNRTKFFDKDSN